MNALLILGPESPIKSFSACAAISNYSDEAAIWRGHIRGISPSNLLC